jgi:hypothetical protein
VSFILQSHKSAIPNFEAWYGPFQSKFDADPLMRWAKNARNKIEKQGDLQTLSQVRAELVAAYLHGPRTDWLPSNVMWGSEQFRQSIPQRLLDAHVIENGALAIERRWIDVELPDYEVLDALAHVYGQLALMVISLHDHCGVLIPEARPELGEHLLHDLLPDGRLRSMVPPFEDRGIYIAIKDGAFLGYRREFRTVRSGDARKASRRYRKAQGWTKLNEAKSLLEVAEIYFENTKAVMLKDGFHVSMFVPLKANIPVDLIVAPPQNRLDKYLLMRDIAHYVRRIGADGLLAISEAWTAKQDDVPKGKFAADVANRGESITLTAVNAGGEQITLSAGIVRKTWKKHKVKQLLPSKTELGGRIIFMAPVFEIWGKLDVLRLDGDDEAMLQLEKHFRPEMPDT